MYMRVLGSLIAVAVLGLLTLTPSSLATSSLATSSLATSSLATSSLATSSLATSSLATPSLPTKSWATPFPSTPSVSLSNHLAILSLNVWQFPYGIVSTHNQKRALKLADHLRANHHRYDVIALQELWSNKTRRIIREGIADLYPYHYEDKQYGAFFIGAHSGLALYSKHPITRRMQYTYRHFRGPEHFARKGLLAIELSIAGKPVIVATTHLQANDGNILTQGCSQCHPSCDEVVIFQLAEAKIALSKFSAPLPAAPVLLTGDLNVDGESPLFIEALSILRPARDTFAGTISPFSASFWPDYPRSGRLDHIVSMGAPISGFSYLYGDLGPSISDHLAIVGSFDLTPPS